VVGLVLLCPSKQSKRSTKSSGLTLAGGSLSVSKNDTIRIEYDDDVIHIIDKINKTLAPHNFTLKDDMQEHDGWIILTLEKIEDESPQTEPVPLRKCECGRAIYTQYGFCGGCGK
jgi:hypothetical protein